MAHGDANCFGEFPHLHFYAQVLAFCQRVGNGVYYPELFEVFQDMPVENGQVLVEADVSQENLGNVLVFTLNVQTKNQHTKNILSKGRAL